MPKVLPVREWWFKTWVAKSGWTPGQPLPLSMNFATRYHNRLGSICRWCLGCGLGTEEAVDLENPPDHWFLAYSMSDQKTCAACDGSGVDPQAVRATLAGRVVAVRSPSRYARRLNRQRVVSG